MKEAKDILKLAKAILATDVTSKQIGVEVKRALSRPAKIKVTPKGVEVYIESEYPYQVMMPLIFVYRRGEWKVGKRDIDLDSSNLQRSIQDEVRDYIKRFNVAEKRQLWQMEGTKLIYDGIAKGLGSKWDEHFSNPEYNQYYSAGTVVEGQDGKVTAEVTLERNSGLNVRIQFRAEILGGFPKVLFDQTTNRPLFDKDGVIIADMKDVKQTVKDVVGVIIEHYKWVPKGMVKTIQKAVEESTAEDRAKEEEQRLEEEAARLRQEAREALRLRISGLQKAANKLSNDMEKEFSDVMSEIKVTPESNGVSMKVKWIKHFKETPFGCRVLENGLQLYYPEANEEYTLNNVIEVYKDWKKNITKWAAKVRKRFEEVRIEEEEKVKKVDVQKVIDDSLEDFLEDSMEASDRLYERDLSSEVDEFMRLHNLPGNSVSTLDARAAMKSLVKQGRAWYEGNGWTPPHQDDDDDDDDDDSGGGYSSGGYSSGRGNIFKMKYNRI